MRKRKLNKAIFDPDVTNPEHVLLVIPILKKIYHTQTRSNLVSNCLKEEGPKTIRYSNKSQKKRNFKSGAIISHNLIRKKIQSGRFGRCSRSKEGVVNGPFKNTGLAKVFVKFLRSHSLDFCADCQGLGVSNCCKVVSDYRYRSRILKGKKVSGSQRKTPVLPSRKVSLLPLATPQGNSLTKKINIRYFT